jgi:hypothetical protein
MLEYLRYKYVSINPDSPSGNSFYYRRVFPIHFDKQSELNTLEMKVKSGNTAPKAL